MYKSLMISRRFILKDVGDRLSPAERDMTGMIDQGIVNVKATADQIEVTYDQQIYKFSDILPKLFDSGMKIEKGFLFGLKSSWLDYLDTVARANASAPPPSCCNKPPRRR